MSSRYYHLFFILQTNSTLNVVVSAEDEVGGGGKNNIVEVNVTVIVSDENDNLPEFLKVSHSNTKLYNRK